MMERCARGLASLMLLVLLGVASVTPQSAQAQDRAWIQIESTANLRQVQERARLYAEVIDDIVAFRANTGLYAVAIGPYNPADARVILRNLLNQGLVPRDSFVSNGAIYTTQFFPIGADDLATPTTAITGSASTDDAAPTDAVVEVAPAEQQDETLPQARRSEARLNRAERDALQIALQWFGFYTARIDGAFGPGTRRAMEAYQLDQGLPPTGVLTTRQRAQLLQDYRAELAALGIETVRDDVAGIEIDLPLAMVAFSNYNFPFAQFDSINDSGVEVLLISQPGDRTTLFGLYEIMQTLEIVPLQGERNRTRDGFVLTGQSNTLRSHTEARLVNGTVKGFTLVWPPERDAQMARVLPMMQSSIRYFGGALDPTAIPDDAEEAVDLVSGLDVREPDLVRSGFFVDGQGTVLTTDEAVGSCDTILINDVYEADVTYSNESLGLVALAPRQQLAPLNFARFSTQPGRVRSDVAVSGYPFGGSLNAASMSFGQLADLQGVDGEETIQRLAITTTETEAGAPVFDLDGSVLGMVLPKGQSERALPEEVTLALRGDKLADVLTDAGIPLSTSTRQGAMNRDNLARFGADMTVTVSCWN